MKKTYMKPEMGIEVIELENMIAASFDLKIGEGPASGSMEMKSSNDGDWELW